MNCIKIKYQIIINLITALMFTFVTVLPLSSFATENYDNSINTINLDTALSPLNLEAKISSANPDKTIPTKEVISTPENHGEKYLPQETEPFWMLSHIIIIIIIFIIFTAIALSGRYVRDNLRLLQEEIKSRQRETVFGHAQTNWPGQNVYDNFPLPALSSEMERCLESDVFELSTIKINLLGTSKDVQSILISSCFKGEGKSRSAIYLSHGLSLSGEKVLLIDANYYSPTIHKQYGIDESQKGLVQVLHQKESATEVIQKTKYNNLWVMPFGEYEVQEKILAADNWEPFFAKLKQKFDYIVMDSPCINGHPNTPFLSLIVDATILVVEAEKTKWEVVQMAIRRMTFIGGKSVGVIINKRQYYIPKIFYKMF